MSQVPAPGTGGPTEPPRPFVSPSADSPPPPDPPQLPAQGEAAAPDAVPAAGRDALASQGGPAQPEDGNGPDEEPAPPSLMPDYGPGWGGAPASAPDWEASPYPPQAPAAPPAFGPEDQRVPAPPAGRRRWWIAAAVLVVLILAALVVWLLVRPSNDARPEQITVPTQISVADIQVGDCLEKLPAPAALDTVDLVGCAQYHAAQIVAEVTVAQAGDYPGESQLSGSVTQQCQPTWTDAQPKVDQLADTTVHVGTTVIYPSAQSWKAGDRSGWCLVYGIDGTFAGSLLN